MPERQRCRQCGAAMRGEDERAICPACHLELGLGGITEMPEGDRTVQPDESGPGRPMAPESIGPYRILRVLGEGGMGLVYLAEQHEPIRRRVALKVIKSGMDTKAVIARFEGERQALAMMNHPTIARVFDAGETAGGRPYFVMELVEGEPITLYCDRHRLPLRRRLELFTQVCEGVQHAHQKGVIHRDIKPSNVLVTDLDGTATPKIIDFGVAKAIEQRLAERTMFTELGVMVGTPEYMSPEQAELSPLGVDTRTDVYSLGVLLYELLVGALPFDSEHLRSRGFDEIRRIIREEEPPVPSSRVQSLGDQSSDAAQRRRLDPPSLHRRLTGDLDWIVMMALEKDRTRRYGSPLSMAEDIARHLQDEPVVACPPSAAYQFGKFVRRNKLLVGSLTAVGLALVVGAVTATAFAVSEAEQRREAEQARADLELVSRFQSKMLLDIDAARMGQRLHEDLRSRGLEGQAAAHIAAGAAESERVAFDRFIGRINLTDVALRSIDREILERASRTVVEQYSDRPEVAGDLMITLAKVYYELGLYPQAERSAGAAISHYEEEFGRKHRATLLAVELEGGILAAQGRFAEAESRMREVLEARRELLGTEDEQTLSSLLHLAVMVGEQGRLNESEPLLREALDLRRRVQGVEHPETIRAMNNYGSLLLQLGRLDDAEPHLAESVAVGRRVLPADNIHLMTYVNVLARLQLMQGRFESAESLLREVLESRQRTLGSEHSLTLTSLNNLGYALSQQRRFDEAAPLLLQALEGRTRVLGPDHHETLQSLNNLGALYRNKGELDRAVSYYRQSLEGRRRVLGPAHPSTLTAYHNLSEVFRQRGDLDRALEYLLTAVDGRRRVLGEDHADTLASVSGLGLLYQLQGRMDEAERLLLDSFERSAKTLGEDHRFTRTVVRYLADLYAAWGKVDEAERWRARLPPDGPLVAP